MKYTFVTALLLSSSAAFSQEPSNVAEADWNPADYRVGEMYPGYIIELDGDTVQGFIKADTRCSTGGIGSSNQNTAAFYLNATDKKPVAKYKPDEIKGYKIGDKIYESINYSGGLLKKPNFNIVIKEGKIRTYEWYSTVENYMSLRRKEEEGWKDFDNRAYEVKTLFAKDPKEPIELAMLGMGFAKKMPEMISDNPEMAQKVAAKEKGYKFIDMYGVIEEYNKWAAAQK